MKELLKSLLVEMREGFKDLRADISRVEAKLDDFRTEQDTVNKLLTGDTKGIKSMTDNLEEKIIGVRDALQ